MDREASGAATADELVAGFRQMHALSQAASAQMLSFIAECDRRQVWRDDGATGMVPWIAAQAAVNHHAAGEWLRVAKSLEDLSRIRQLYSDGQLSWPQVQAMTRRRRPKRSSSITRAG